MRLSPFKNLIALACVLSFDLLATTFTVTNTNDSGTGSLRDAFSMSNAMPGINTIDMSGLDPSSVILLTTGDIPNAAFTTLNTGDNTILIAGFGISGANTWSVTKGDNSGDIGSLVFDAPNPYFGDTTIAYGTLALAGNGSIANSGGVVLANNAALAVSEVTAPTAIKFIAGGPDNQIILGSNTLSVVVDSTTGPATFSGVFIGPGSLIKDGSEVLTLANISNVTGPVNVAAGTLALLGSGDISSASSVSVSSGATLDISGTTAGATVQNLGTDPGSSTNLGAQPLTVNTTTSTATAGPINGSGDFIVVGPGTVAVPYQTVHLYTGRTIVKAQGLVVDGSIASSSLLIIKEGGLVTGKGLVPTTENDGRIGAQGSIATLTVEGAYTQGGTGGLLSDITPAEADLIVVTGAAALNGLLEIIPESGVYLAGTSYTILTSAGGVSGSFASKTVDSSTINASQFGVSYLPNSVVLTVLDQAIELTGPLKHHNPTQVFNYLTTANYVSDPDLLSVVNTLAALSDPSSALDQLHPAIFGAFELLNINTSSMVAKIFNRRLSTDCPMYINECCECNQLNVWLEPFGYYIDQDRVGEQMGFHGDAIGILGGFDYTFKNGFLLGFGVGYDRENIHWKQHRGRGDINSGHLGIYADWIQTDYYVEAAAIFGINAYDASRYMNFSTIDRTAKHDSKGYDFTGHLAGGYYFKYCEYEFGPFASIDYLYLHQNGFKEKGASSLNLDVDAKNSNMLRSEAGLDFTHSMTFGCVVFVPTIWVSCVNESYLNISHYKASLIGQSGDFEVRSWNKSITMVSPGIELDFLFENNFSLGVCYSAELNGQVATQKGDLRLEFSF